jgi:hypothetical protein
MGEAVAHIFMRTVKPSVFDMSMGKRAMVFYWDMGNGFNRNNCKVDEFVLNNRNKIWKRFGMKLENCDNRMVGFTVGYVGEVVQLTGVTVHYRPENGEPKKVRFSHETIQKSGYKHLYQNLYSVSDDPPLLVVPTEEAVGFTGEIDVDIFFSIVTGDSNG